MKHSKFSSDENGQSQVHTSKTGQEMLRDPLLNKGSGFSPNERQEFKLEGLLPAHFNTIEMQAERRLASITSYDEPFNRYLEMCALQDRNEHLFYRVLCDNLETFLPIVYTPTVAQATQQYSAAFRRGRGIWITPDMRGRIKDVLDTASTPHDVNLIVVTDNESILGIGDQGAGGMAISVGKLSLYCAAGGIHPAKTLPISLDVGTNNQKLLDDDLYLGWRHPRLRGEKYDELVAEFVTAVKEIFPKALVQWEDFRKDNALKILEKYRTTLLSFNDDIQGTGAVAVAGVLSALRKTKGALSEQRILIHGAGAAGLGIARQFQAAMRDEGADENTILKQIGLLDSRGLLVDDREFKDEYKNKLSWPTTYAQELGLDKTNERTLHHVVAAFKPNVLIGASGQAGAFDQALVETLCSHIEHPIIMPFSNPTSISEAVPEDVIRWSKGKALVATGSPFLPVQYQGKEIKVGQGNNVFIFPGLGMGAIIAGATMVTDGMISAASNALANAVSHEELADGLLFPAIPRLREVSTQIARAVIQKASSDGVAELYSEDEITDLLVQHIWTPEYPVFNAMAS